MGVTLDGVKIFDDFGVAIECGSVSRESQEKTIAGLDGVLSIDMGGRGRKIKQRGVLRAVSKDKLNDKISTISGYIDGNTHTLVTNDGQTFDNVRVDSLKVTKESVGGSGVSCEYEIVYKQLVV